MFFVLGVVLGPEEKKRNGERSFFVCSESPSRRSPPSLLLFFSSLLILRYSLLNLADGDESEKVLSFEFLMVVLLVFVFVEFGRHWFRSTFVLQSKKEKDMLAALKTAQGLFTNQRTNKHLGTKLTSSLPFSTRPTKKIFFSGRFCRTLLPPTKNQLTPKTTLCRTTLSLWSNLLPTRSPPPFVQLSSPNSLLLFGCLVF